MCRTFTVLGAVLMASLSFGANAHEIYAKAGFLGAGVGYAYGVNESFTLRGDVTTMGSYHRDGNVSNLDYKGTLRNNQAMVYGDWFPFNNGFRLSAGLGVRDTRIKADGRPNSNGNVTIGDTTVAYGADDSVSATAELPAVAPYIGIGWGHNVGQQRKAGWGFVADAGIAFGKPKVNFSVSDSLYAKLNAATGGQAQAEIDKQQREIEDKANKLKVFPSLYIGVSYTF